MLSKSDKIQLNEDLHYMNMMELKETCKELGLPYTEKKPALIEYIMSFIEYGKITQKISIPSKSTAKKGELYPLKPETLILFGNYKNDLSTRIFMKKLIGSHFHFTAFGQDWIKKRWSEKNPPTYQEFARFWQYEYENRKNKKSPLKKEWAYLNFIRNYLEKNSNASQQEITKNWKAERQKHVSQAQEVLKKFLKSKEIKA